MGRKEIKETVGVAIPANIDRDSGFQSAITQLFLEQRTDARTADSFIQHRLNVMLADGQSKPPTFRETLYRFQAASSVEQTCSHAREYVSGLILASTILDDSMDDLLRMQTMLQWVLSVLLPSVGEGVYKHVGANSETLGATRASVINLLSRLGNPSVLATAGSSVAVTTPGQPVVPVSLVESPCERCYKCLSFISSPKLLFVCRHKPPDGVRCSVGYCSACVRTASEDKFLCAFHQGRPNDRMQIFPRIGCWNCPPGTKRPPRVVSLRHCFWCGKENFGVGFLQRQTC